MKDQEAMKTCEWCGATNATVGRRLQPVIVLGQMFVLNGVHCDSCRAAIARARIVIEGDRVILELPPLVAAALPQPASPPPAGVLTPPVPGIGSKAP